MIDSYERLEKTLGLQYLYDRMCDLKIRIAELNYALGLACRLGGDLSGSCPPGYFAPGCWLETGNRANQHAHTAGCRRLGE